MHFFKKKIPKGSLRKKVQVGAELQTTFNKENAKAMPDEKERKRKNKPLSLQKREREKLTIYIETERMVSSPGGY